MTEPRRDLSMAWLCLLIGGFIIGAGALVDWLATDSGTVPGIWLVMERVSGAHGWMSWMTFLGLLMLSVGGHELAQKGRGRWLRRVPGGVVAAALAVLAWSSWNADRYVLLVCAGLLAVATLQDPQRALPEARARART